MARIELQDISMSFPAPLVERFNFPFLSRQRMPEDRGGIAALEHINLAIPDGQTFVVVGPSGCGKSTLLRVVAGLNREYTGRVLYDGVDVQQLPPKERQIGMVFQNYALYPHFKGEGNLSFFFKMHNISDEETRERVRYTSELMGVGFDALLQRKPGTLSGGQKQRLAIARAIVRSPRLFLFDEPLSNLDAKLRVQTRTEIKRLLQRFGITSMYVTHDQVEAIALADQIVVMRSGRVEQVGAYQDLIDRPANLFVAGFLGLSPMTMLPGGRVTAGKLTLAGAHIPLPERLRAIAREGQSVVIGLRAEAVSVPGGRQLPGATAYPVGIRLQAEIEAIEPDYSRHVQYLQLRSGELRYPATCSIDTPLNVGVTVQAQLDPTCLHFFDESTGLAL